MANASTKAVRACCKKLKISADVESRLVSQVGYLKQYKEEISPASQTETQRANALKKIENLAAKLRLEVKGLNFYDRTALDDQFFFENDMRVAFSVLEQVENPAVFDLADSLIPGIEYATTVVRGRLANVGKKSRPKVTERQADFIRCIAQVLKRACITPAYSGPFIEICEAAFQDAGLSFPDRANRHFMQKIRPKMKEQGLCL